MTTSKKKVNISKESKEEADQLKTTVELYRELSDYERMIAHENDRKKNKMARDLALNGEEYVDEIQTKFTLKEEERIKNVEYILKNATKDKYGSSRQLYDMSYEEVNSIYTKVV